MGGGNSQRKRGSAALHEGKPGSRNELIKLVGRDPKDFEGVEPRISVDGPFILYSAWVRVLAAWVRATAKLGRNPNSQLSAGASQIWAVRGALKPLEVLRKLFPKSKTDLLTETGEHRSPKDRAPAKEEMDKIKEGFHLMDQRSNRGRNGSTTNRVLTRDLRSVNGYQKATLLKDALAERKNLEVKLTADADGCFFRYGPNAPIFQIAFAGQRVKQCDLDALLSLAVADSHVLLLVIVTSDESGQMSVADGPKFRRCVVGSYVPRTAKQCGGDAGFSLPFRSCNTAVLKLAWLIAVIVLALDGFSDYGVKLLAMFDGEADKTIRVTVFCKYLDAFVASKREMTLQSFSLDEFFAYCVSNADSGTVFGRLVVSEHFADFKVKVRAGLFKGVTAHLALTRQLEDTVDDLVAVGAVRNALNLDELNLDELVQPLLFPHIEATFEILDAKLQPAELIRDYRKKKGIELVPKSKWTRVKRKKRGKRVRLSQQKSQFFGNSGFQVLSDKFDPFAYKTSQPAKSKPAKSKRKNVMDELLDEMVDKVVDEVVDDVVDDVADDKVADVSAEHVVVPQPKKKKKKVGVSQQKKKKKKKKTAVKGGKKKKVPRGRRDRSPAGSSSEEELEGLQKVKKQPKRTHEESVLSADGAVAGMVPVGSRTLMAGEQDCASVEGWPASSMVELDADGPEGVEPKGDERSAPGSSRSQSRRRERERSGSEDEVLGEIGERKRTGAVGDSDGKERGRMSQRQAQDGVGHGLDEAAVGDKQMGDKQMGAAEEEGASEASSGGRRSRRLRGGSKPSDVEECVDDGDDFVASDDWDEDDDEVLDEEDDDDDFEQDNKARKPRAKKPAKQASAEKPKKRQKSSSKRKRQDRPAAPVASSYKRGKSKGGDNDYDDDEDDWKQKDEPKEWVSKELGGFRGVFGTGDFAKLLMSSVSEDVMEMRKFLFALAPIFGRNRMPVHTAAFWRGVISGMDSLFKGLWKVKVCFIMPWKLERKVGRDRAKQNKEYVSLKGLDQESFHIRYNSDQFKQDIMLAVKEARQSLSVTKIDFDKLRVTFKESGSTGAFLESTSNLLSSVIRTPMQENVQRILFGVVSEEVENAFFGHVSELKGQTEETRAKFRAAWAATREDNFAERILLDDSADSEEFTSKELTSIIGSALPAESMKAIVVRVLECQAAIKELDFEDQSSGAKRSLKDIFEERVAPHCAWKSQLTLLDAAEELWRKRNPLCKSVKRYPEVQRRHRGGTSSSELSTGGRLGLVRATIRKAHEFGDINLDTLNRAAKWLETVPKTDFDTRGWGNGLSDKAIAPGPLKWITLLRWLNPGERREAIYARIAKCKGAHSLLTDGIAVRLLSKLTVEKTPWLAKQSNRDVQLTAKGLLSLYTALEIDGRQELERLVTARSEEGASRPLDTYARWEEMKELTESKKDDRCGLVFGAPDPKLKKRAEKLRYKQLYYDTLQKLKLDGYDLCRASKATGFLPSRILAEVRGEKHFDDVIAFYVDPGVVNFVAGVARVVKNGKEIFYPFRVTGAYYHHRVGANRVRAQTEAREQAKKDVDERSSIAQAKQRRLLEEGKRQLFHEILASWRLFADTHGDGRDFVVIWEGSSGGGIGGSSHRIPATQEFRQFLSEFVMVGATSGYNSSQICSRCGHRLKYAFPKHEIRTKKCESEACSKGGNDFYVDRDYNAAVNFARIDQAEARGLPRPECFQSKDYKVRVAQSIPSSSTISPDASASGVALSGASAPDLTAHSTDPSVEGLVDDATHVVATNVSAFVAPDSVASQSILGN